MTTIRMTCTETEENVLLTADAVRAGEGLCVYLYGGDLPHAGAFAMAEPVCDGTARLLWCENRTGHRDDVLARSAAVQLCKALQIPVSVTAGVHIDGITAEEIAAVFDASDRLIRRLAEALQDD